MNRRHQHDHGFEGEALGVTRALQDRGFTAYWAGGCVRDRLLGRTPKDIDIATPARPEEIHALFPKARGIGRAFGVMLVPAGKHHFEVSTFRQDHGILDGRRPEKVSFTGPREDARRRDFTVNGMF